MHTGKARACDEGAGATYADCARIVSGSSAGGDTDGVPQAPCCTIQRRRRFALTL